MKKRDTRGVTLAEIRTAVADYIGTEGCSCCESPSHPDHKERLAKLLRVKKYDDGSGYDFGRYAKHTKYRIDAPY